MQNERRVMSYRKESLQTNLTTIQGTIKDYVASVKAYVQDKSEPLDARWECFYAAGEAGLLPHDRYMFRPSGFEKTTYYDQGFEKFERMDIKSFENMMQCKVEEAEDECSVEDLYDIAAFKESWLEEFIFSFTYDW